MQNTGAVNVGGVMAAQGNTSSNEQLPPLCDLD